ncbi:MAG: DNA-processing protein DprA [Rhizobiaceae bacterium]|nr:DNA-processing protein DprA [Rhizobiaceae bacterium]
MTGAAEGTSLSQQQGLSDRQRLAWLRLIRSENVGPLTFRDLINRFGSAEAALQALPELAQRGGGRARICRADDAEKELETAARFGARFIALGEAGYPPLLKLMPGPPPLLAVKGEPAVLALPCVAIVGARNASLAGIRFARQLARDVGAQGYAIASGLARGIDAAAHTGSFDTGTIAAMAGGLDRPYPPEHEVLCNEIVARGALISEMPFGWEPRAKDFPRRNRLIAGLAYGLVVVEAALRSGSLISARLAGEFGRLVFAVPGSPLDPRAAGTNGLLKEGAILVTGADDVLHAIAPQSGLEVRPAASFEEPVDFAAAPEPGEDDRSRVVEALSPTPVPIDEIVRHTGLHPAQVHLVLLELQLAGRLERHSGGAVSLLL